VRVRIDEERCEGHGRCYALAPELFEPDEIGNARVVGDGTVSPDRADNARLAAANCPELAVLIEGSGGEGADGGAGADGGEG
jgi:ferredoxin